MSSLLDLAAVGKIPPRLANALVVDGRHTVEDLAAMSLRDLRLVAKMGPIGRQIVRTLLAEFGYDAAHFMEPPPR
jgi:hypothetical protein